METILFPDTDPADTAGWLESFESVIKGEGRPRGRTILSRLIQYGYQKGVILPFTANTPYINTIPVDEQLPYPGDLDIERLVVRVADQVV